MSYENIKKDIHEIILKTFRSLVSPTDKNTAVTKDKGFRIKYPYKYNRNETKSEIRISEQELKQVFIYNLQGFPYWFSVETPTVNKYLFKDKENGPTVESKNQSASVDLSIYPDEETNKPCAHIEFKFRNPEPMAIQKDILKLYKEDIEIGFFVQILKSDNVDTWKNLCEKFLGKERFLKQIKESKHEVYVYILSLKSGNCFISDRDLKTILLDGKPTFTPKQLSECE